MAPRTAQAGHASVCTVYSRHAGELCSLIHGIYYGDFSIPEPHANRPGNRRIGMMPDEFPLGARLQAARRAIGLTQTEVGRQMEMVTSTISAIEAGKRSVSGTEL